MLGRVTAVLAVSLCAPAMASAALPDVRAIELRGVDAYGPEQVRRILRVQPPEPLRRSPEALAASLETRYHDDGYPAAVVAASYDDATSTLVLTADEGHLVETVFEGLDKRAAESARSAAGLVTGRVLRSRDITDAFDRLESASHGALRAGDSRIELVPGGARLVLTPERAGLQISPLLDGGLRPVYSWNRVDGLNIPLGAEITAFDRSAYNHLTVHAIGFFGTSSSKLRYAAGVSRPFGANQRVTLGYEYHDLTDTDDLFRSWGLESAGGTPIYFEAYADYFRRRGHEAHVFVRLTGKAEIGLAWRSDDYESVPVTTGSSDSNPTIAEGRMRSLVATVRVGTDILFANAVEERRSFWSRSLYGSHEAPGLLRAEATFEAASRGAFGGDFDFRRLVTNERSHIGLPHAMAVDSRVLVGWSDGTPPPQKRFFLGGVGTLRGYPERIFPGDNMAAATVEWRLDPGRFLPRFIAFYDGGATWTSGITGAGWKSDLGVGFKWPAEAPLFLRVDVAKPVGDSEDTDVRTLFRIQIPF